MYLDYASYADATQRFTFSERWLVFDGEKGCFNIAYECIDRHPKRDVAVRIKFDDGRCEAYTFAQMSQLTSQFANFLARRGIGVGDRVVIILNPSLEFYVCLFGTLKRGAVVVPCFPAFGPEAIEYRMVESGARMVVVDAGKVGLIREDADCQIIYANDLISMIKGEDDRFTANTSADNLAVMQFSSGTTGVPKIVPYKHAAATLTAVYMKLAVGLRADDSYFCPSSPAWGHGIWYGSVGPLVFGKAISTYSGKFKVERLLEALEEFAVTNMSATPLIYRSIMQYGQIDRYRLTLRDLSFTGGPMDKDTRDFFREKMGLNVRSYYGSTEAGVLILDYPFQDYHVKPGSLGKPMLGLEVAVIDAAGEVMPPGQVGQVAVRRGGGWLRLGDMALVDEDGYFWHKGRLDDVIISAGYTIGPQEVEEVLVKHPAVRRAAVVGSPDPERGEIVKAFIVPNQAPSEELEREIREFVRTRLSKHEYPREIEFVDVLPETPDGKIRRSELRARERAKKQL